jgi:hypothetical protein
MTPNTVTADTHWVWTDKAQEKNPKYAKAGAPIWYHQQKNAPKFMLDQGLICDSTEFVKEGQADIFEYI